ncbi:hypothetical protein SAMN05443507_108133 [Alicyclobacillus tolerans]|uniref:Uncharacterized protein n=1 Tax=Alicyclobacillus tolerans TaxID=90970 RepID=A0A1M6PTJ2_9BACL|nr:hypothetical protein SAMN05443507_108133 [Alicyclobacillus montanus]
MIYLYTAEDKLVYIVVDNFLLTVLMAEDTWGGTTSGNQCGNRTS